ncbi:zinc-dependent alcohol dehydrogenase family protein (plasmid) [Haloferacaceae archaeon DSL9]
MRGAVLKEYGEPLEIEERETPDPGPDEVLVETEACGICRSDWHAWQGDYGWLEGGKVPCGHILGHEPAGTIVAAGDDVVNYSEGDQVVLPFNIVCGKCNRCRNGDSHMCENVVHYGFEVQPGAFCDQIRVPNADFNLARIPEGLRPVDMAALGCRYVTSYHAMVDRAQVEPGEWVAVHGCGGIGLSVINIATALGGNVIAVDLQDEKLELATDMGAVATVNGADIGDVPGEIEDITDGGADLSVDALGIEETCRNSINSVKTMGRHMQLGITTAEEQGMVNLPVDAMLHEEIDFLTAKGMPPHRYDEIFRMMETGKLTPQKLVTKEVNLEDVSDRLDAMTNFDVQGIEVITEF